MFRLFLLLGAIGVAYNFLPATIIFGFFAWLFFTIFALVGACTFIKPSVMAEAKVSWHLMPTWRKIYLQGMDCVIFAILATNGAPVLATIWAINFFLAHYIIHTHYREKAKL